MLKRLTSRQRRVLWCVGVLSLGLAVAEPAHAVYLYYLRHDLRRAIDENDAEMVGRQVTFTDELCVIWPQAVERPNSVDRERYIIFDTELFHCAVPERNAGRHLQEAWQTAQTGYSETLNQLEEINDREHRNEISGSEAQERRRELYWNLYRIWSNPPIVTVMGTVQRADFWGPVRGNGVSTERITIVCDEVRRPRQRYYEFGLDE